MSTQKLGDRLNKLTRNKNDFEKKQEETGSSRRHSRYGSDNKSQFTGSFTVAETNKRMCAYCGTMQYKNNTGVTNAMNILTCKVENPKKRVFASFV